MGWIPHCRHAYGPRKFVPCDSYPQDWGLERQLEYIRRPPREVVSITSPQQPRNIEIQSRAIVMPDNELESSNRADEEMHLNRTASHQKGVVASLAPASTDARVTVTYPDSTRL
jgi:hypothetical protein